MAEERETQQAVALEAPFEHLATKEDVANVRAEIESVRTYIEQVRNDLNNRIAALEKNVESIRAEMRTMKWMMGIVVAAVLVQLLERFFA